ncbi:hypothetical protein SDC9_209715 [bioreactor metagenome]|uniref:Uncharacterized protein n=1 Tax=bioreactor metagenome TaxID=1076179 RepID=A0A645JH03_9ZZZZ
MPRLVNALNGHLSVKENLQVVACIPVKMYDTLIRVNGRAKIAVPKILIHRFGRYGPRQRRLAYAFRSFIHNFASNVLPR